MTHRIKTRTLFGMMMVLVPAPATAVADEWGEITRTKFDSHEGTFFVTIKPHDDWHEHPGHCLATLYRSTSKKKAPQWSRHLINNHAPVQVYVADTGKYVVTTDEWHRVGELPVVIYGERGELIKVFSLEDLGMDEAIEKIQVTVSSYWWSQDALVFFGPRDEWFIARLHWGDLLIIELRDGTLRRMEDLPKPTQDELTAFIRTRAKERVLAMLHAKDPLDRHTAALHAGQLKITEAKPVLRALLLDEAAYKTYPPKEGKTVYFVREAAAKALEAMGEKQKQ
jgi:hypothetical protein